MEVYVECYCCGGNQQLLLNRPTRLTVPGLAVSPLFQYVSGRVVAKSDLDLATFLNAKCTLAALRPLRSAARCLHVVVDLLVT